VVLAVMMMMIERAYNASSLTSLNSIPNAHVGFV
jgi:hypothetical protein